MCNAVPEDEIVALLLKYEASGGVLDYVFLDLPAGETPAELHRAAALAGIAVIADRLEQWALHQASEAHPLRMFFRVQSEANKLTGKPVDFATFWGTDDVEPKHRSKNGCIIPNVDGYKTAFFHPPYKLAGTPDKLAALFASINAYLLGDEPEQAEIFSWSTDWSNYFEAGHEWWGAFFWTIRQAGSQCFGVVGASSTD